MAPARRLLRSSTTGVALPSAARITSIGFSPVFSSTNSKAWYKIFLATPFLPSRIRLFTNLVTSLSLKIGSGCTSLLSALFLRILSYLRSEEHTSELQSRGHLVCRLLLEKKN